MERKVPAEIIAVIYKGLYSEEAWIDHVKNPSIMAVYALVCGGCGKQGFWGEVEKDGETSITHFSRRCPEPYHPPQKRITCCPNRECGVKLDPPVGLDRPRLAAGYGELTDNNIPLDLWYSTSTGIIWMGGLKGLRPFFDYFAAHLGKALP